MNKAKRHISRRQPPGQHDHAQAEHSQYQ